ncbi:MAG: ABC transporter permease [Lentisphaeria bacterium]|nr:ABC transporter permease [Lentisphaeria bacterium]NQZ70084.1 ABC transporter permease [Lentisphaeria bacterium]
MKTEEETTDKADMVETQWFLFQRKFRRHKLAMTALVVLTIMFICGVLFPGFFAPYSMRHRFENEYQPPQNIRFVDAEENFHFRPFTYNVIQVLDEETWQYANHIDTSKRYPIQFFTHGDTYNLMGLFETDIHLFGFKDGGTLFLFGTDKLGRDILSRSLYALRISMVIGLMGVFLSIFLGVIIGGISGFVGGIIDDLIQRFIEIIMSIPQIPLWMAFAAAIPRDWSAIDRYFAITLIMSILGWTTLSRVVRSKFLSMREEDYITAAIGFNVPMLRLIRVHMIPNFMSYILVHLTLAIPGMILGETALSFLGIGLQAPVVSLGVLLQDGQNIQDITMHPWLLIPGVFVIMIVLTYSFIGDGLRDAADPYK